LSVLVVMLFFTLEFGLTVVRYNVLSAAARTVARQAIVRGESSYPERTPWGPSELSGTAGDGSEPAAAAAALLATLNPSEVTMQVVWLDGSNRAGNRVRVTLHYIAAPRVPMLDLGTFYDLRAESTMQIVH
jgi:hypothetical protein